MRPKTMDVKRVLLLAGLTFDFRESGMMKQFKAFTYIAPNLKMHGLGDTKQDLQRCCEVPHVTLPMSIKMMKEVTDTVPENSS